MTLEGIALTADPDYGLVLEAYPFVARKLMSEDRPELQQVSCSRSTPLTPSYPLSRTR